MYEWFKIPRKDERPPVEEGSRGRGGWTFQRGASDFSESLMYKLYNLIYIRFIRISEKRINVNCVVSSQILLGELVKDKTIEIIIMLGVNNIHF